LPRLTMSDTDMVLIDMDPNDPFDFYLEHYKEQLVAGYTKETPSFGLRVYMRDFNKLHRKDSRIEAATIRNRKCFLASLWVEVWIIADVSQCQSRSLPHPSL